MKTKIKLMIAEDQTLVRKAFILLINEIRDVEVVDEAADGRELLKKVKNQIPDIILMDHKMPILGGKEALMILKIKHPEIKIIMMSSNDHYEVILDLVSNGANGFLSKNTTPETLSLTINKVYNEGFYFDSNISQLMITRITNEKNKNEKSNKSSLSERELSVLKEICNGNTNKLISEKLYISSSTVDFHKGNIYRKTHAKNIADLVIYAVRHNIIQVTLEHH